MERADTGGMRGFGNSRPGSIGVLPRADSVAGSRGGGGGGGGGFNRPGTAKMGERTGFFSCLGLHRVLSCSVFCIVVFQNARPGLT